MDINAVLLDNQKRIVFFEFEEEKVAYFWIFWHRDDEGGIFQNLETLLAQESVKDVRKGEWLGFIHRKKTC